MSIKSILFVLFTGLFGFCASMFISSLGNTREEGFSSAATAFGNGLIGAVLGMIIGGIVAKKLRPTQFRLTFLVLIIGFALLLLWFYYRWNLLL
ncbi:MAG: hypothetical protein SH818_14375 [Saprospiraceae bacterium]|nr:hypothetical protein [Saprospiraceae bacterium]